MKKWLCVICGLIYDEAEGWPDDGIAPGTRWEDVPDDWTCPDCGVGKEDFEMIEMSGDEAEPAPAAVVAPAEPAELPVAAVAATPAATDNTTTSNAPIVIIGSGYAGYGLAEGLRKQSADVAIVLFTADDGANYSKPGLSNAMARQKTAEALVTQTATQMADKLSITVHAHTTVDSIDPQQRQVSYAGGVQPYSKLVLATGAQPITLPLSGDGAVDVLSVNSLSDYRVFRERLAAAAGKRVVVIGNGLVGCEYANELAVQGYQVTVVGLTQWPLDPVLPEAIGRALQQRLSALGVQWHLGNSVTTVNKQGAGYQLALAQGETLEADLVLSAVGLRPNVALAADAAVACNRGIVVDATLQTSVDGIYALGDCTEIQGQVLPYIAPITAGLRALPETLLGNAMPVDYPLMPVVVKTPALPLLMMPPKPGAAGEWQVETVADGLRGVCRDAEGKVIGFALADKAQTERQQWLDAMRAG